MRLRRYIKHSRQCLTTFPNTSKLAKNTPLRVVFKLSSRCLEMWLNMVFRVWHITWKFVWIQPRSKTQIRRTDDRNEWKLLPETRQFFQWSQLFHCPWYLQGFYPKMTKYYHHSPTFETFVKCTNQTRTGLCNIRAINSEIRAIKSEIRRTEKFHLQKFKPSLLVSRNHIYSCLAFKGDGWI